MLVFIGVRGKRLELTFLGMTMHGYDVTQFLRLDAFNVCWANTSGNGLVSAVVRRAVRGVKTDFDTLLNDSAIEKVIDKQVVFSELITRPNAV